MTIDTIERLKQLQKDINAVIDNAITDAIKEKQSRCTHKDKDGRATIEYCDINEMRSRDMYCYQCGKYGSYDELTGANNK